MNGASQHGFLLSTSFYIVFQVGSEELCKIFTIKHLQKLQLHDQSVGCWSQAHSVHHIHHCLPLFPRGNQHMMHEHG